MKKKGKYFITARKPFRAVCGALCANHETMIEHERECPDCQEIHEYVHRPLTYLADLEK